MQEKLEIPVTIAEEPLDCVVNGTRKMLEDMDTLRKARFGFGSFEITSINATTKRRLGTFRFN